ncbi:MAG: hypothetical protein WA705_29950 [Candidatus Ozemobacteraceae bacterium]
MAKAKTIRKADTGKPVEAPAPRKRGTVTERRDYSSNEVYQEGEMIFHKNWDDVGEVIEVGVTEDGIRKMRVQFDKVGLKTLCMAQGA